MQASAANPVRSDAATCADPAAARSAGSDDDAGGVAVCTAGPAPAATSAGARSASVRSAPAVAPTVICCGAPSPRSDACVASRPAASRGPLHTAMAGAAGWACTRIGRACARARGAKTAAPAPTTTAAARTAPPVICAARAGRARIQPPASSRSVVVAVVASVTRRALRGARGERRVRPDLPTTRGRRRASSSDRRVGSANRSAAITTPACTSAVRHASPACASGRSATVPVIRHSFPFAVSPTTSRSAR